MTEIDGHIGISQHDLISEINVRDNFDTFTLGDASDCLPHAASRAD
jgi:hypothetical protein